MSASSGIYFYFEKHEKGSKIVSRTFANMTIA